MKNKKNWKAIAAMALVVAAISTASTTASAQELDMVRLTPALTRESKAFKIESKAFDAVKCIEAKEMLPISEEDFDMDVVNSVKIKKLVLTKQNMKTSKFVFTKAINIIPATMIFQN